jgi:fructosamine-3-kinase
MEDLPIHGGRGGSTASLEQLGIDLACMHRHRSSHFGWHRDNTIGSTPQINDQTDNWVVFYRRHRLGVQYQLAADHGYGQLLPAGERLMDRLEQFFTDYQPQASLLHGDLWSGNYAIDETGRPVIFDPAVYYGDREADLAMTELFGGFSPRFYAAYNNTYPLDAGYKVRKNLYNLYHILNHLNLFGGGYLGQAERMTNQLLSEVN